MPKQVVVIGTGIGGLSAAIHARLHGFDVLALEQRDAPGGKACQIDEQGYRLDPGPSIVILTEIYDAVFRAAGRTPADYLRFRRLDPFTRVYMEGTDGPIDLPADEQECLKVLAEISPADRDAMVRLLGQLDDAAGAVDQTIFSRPIHQPWQLLQPGLAKFAKAVSVTQPYRKVIDELFQSPLLRAFFYGFPSYSGQSYRSPSPGSLLIPYYMLRRGVWWPEGGIGSIPRSLFRLAAELGVEFRFNCKVTGLCEMGSRVTGVVLEGGERVQADAVISNRDKLATQAMMGKPSDWKPSYSYFTVHAGIRRPMPELKHHTLLIPKEFEPGFEELYQERVFPKRPIVYLNETTAMEPESAPPGCTNLFAVVTVPAMEDHLDWVRDADTYRIRTLQELASHGIEIKETEVDFWRVQTPATFEQRDGNYKGSLYGPDEKRRLWGFMPMRCADERIKNLFYAGGSVQPGAGMPMVTLSGKFAADLAKKHLG